MDRVAIVGLGLIGGSLGLAIRRYLPEVEVIGVARRPETVALAERSGAVSQAGTHLALIASADLVVLSCPLAVTAAVLEDSLPHLAEGARVTDVGSVKASIVARAVRTLEAGRNPFLGGHPMAGKEVSGIEHADADLFRGRAWAFTPHAAGAAEPFGDFLEAIEAIGAHPLNLAPEEHDRYVALVSHVPFLVSSAYLLSVGRESDWARASELAASGFRDVSRLGAGDSEMYAAIAGANREEVLRAWRSLRSALEEIEGAIEGGDAEVLLDLLVAARRIRQDWMGGQGAD
ncbi:MAG TPA: prephenate dehydrogenase/arogenate dehydrogenase family protein [Candidatus Dormibacteraeota bacterium]|nr:prephenate dehydrogenase/arogenate dehydrogenase family protein [Candidatus Dormibacteraeota bacterium]